jgi:hypothetical protein
MGYLWINPQLLRVYASRPLVTFFIPMNSGTTPRIDKIGFSPALFGGGPGVRLRKRHQKRARSWLSRRSAALWLLGYPDATFADAEHALTHAREIGHA